MSALANVPLTLVETWDDVQDLLNWLPERRSWLGVDSETSGLDLGRDRLRLIQVGDADHGWVIPVEQWGYGALAKDILTTYDRPIACQNAPFDQGFFIRDGVGMPWHLIDDTMVMSHLHQSGYATGLKPVSKREFGPEAAAGEMALREGMKKYGWDWGTVPVDFPPYWQYSALDPVLTVRVAEMQAGRVFPSYLRSYDIEMGAEPVFCQAQITGMRVDVDHCRSESLRLESEIATIVPQLPQEDGAPINPDSPKQLARWLESRVGAERLPKRTKGGQISVDDDVLAEFVDEIPECQVVRDYRYRTKLKNSYFDNLLEMNVDGIVHPQIRVLGAEKTGRMSISAPALQTLPKSKVGRQPFIAREGCTIIAADFEGQEMRMLAHLAKEERWLEEFAKGTDPHLWIAGMVYDTDSPSKGQRQVTKAVNFGKAYGAGIKKTAITAGISFDDAEQFIERYDRLFPGVRKYQDDVAEQVRDAAGTRKWGHVHTWTGRKLMVPKDEAYKGVNYTIQGGCAELTKLKVAELANAGLGDEFRLPIHDEVICEVADEDVPEAVETIREVMTEERLFDIPFTVDVHTAKTWGDLYD